MGAPIAVSFSIAVAVTVSRSPEFCTPGRAEDAGRSFAIFNFLHARQHIESFGNFLDGRAGDDWFACGETIQ
jgi:hypothetical protein